MKCPNCNIDILKEHKFCASCGQKNTSLKITLKEFLGSFFQEYISFDTRFFRSIRPLLFNPAFLANKFFEGKRLTYVNPLRFYIFVSFVAFFIAGFTSLTIVNLDDGVTAEEAISLNPDGTVDITLSSGKEIEFDKEEFKKSFDLIQQNKESINENFFKYVSIALFLLMPLFALINSLFFRKRRDFYLEHLILSFHIHTFFFIILIIAMIISFFSDLFSGGIVVLLLSIYTYISMKKYYGATWGGTLWRYLGSVGIYNVALIAAILGISLLAVYFSDASAILDLEVKE